MRITMEIPEDTGGAIVMDGAHVKNLRTKFTYPADAVDRIFDNAAAILSRCPGVGDRACEPAVGIMIGKVQSGKTSNFIGLSALAMDNGYPLIIVLGGTKKNLVDQNCSRISEFFDNSEDVKVMAIGGNNDNSSVLEEGFISDLIRNGDKVVLVVLKNSSRMDNVSEMMRSEIGLEPVLIVDDEGDEATLNGMTYRERCSSTYKSAVDMLNIPGRCGFISVTATPQGNYLIDSEDPISPRFGILIQPGDGYCGLSVFHGEDKARFFREISEEDSEAMETPGDGFPESFLRAFAMFFVGAALRRYNGDNGKHAMLIHNTGIKEPQFLVAERLKDLLKRWDSYVQVHAQGIPDDTYTNRIECFFKGAYEDLRLTNTHLPSYEDLDPHIVQAFNDCQKKILICNGERDDSADQRLKKNNIFVGGNKLQRGITIDGLSVTYMTRRAKKKSNVDTTEQRARWFGYRMKHLNVCRLYATAHIESDYSSILEHEQEFWAHIGGYLNEGYEFGDIPRLLELDSSDLNFTRTNVARAKRLKIPRSETQSYIILDNVVSKRNMEVSEALYSSLQTEKVSWGTTTHHVAYGVPFHVLRERFLDLIELPEEGSFSRIKSKTIETIMEANHVDPPVDVIWMRKGNDQGRTIDPDGRINQLMSGSNSNYPGDRYFDTELKYPTHLKLQIHFVKPIGMDEFRPAMALHLQFPGHFREGISNKLFVRGSDLNDA
ncbi:MAG: hypothetical protein IKG94_07390 [Candidatus Methanomethylophilaceae archaeon]|nr:hypothetical protein [Candidatus Methanomethylophilaceae archaeon]MBR6205204.1 hypothetical protein [Candidatus Methanomethylophilaceae archaeon]